jgi:hypothetical protein
VDRCLFPQREIAVAKHRWSWEFGGGKDVDLDACTDVPPLAIWKWLSIARLDNGDDLSAEYCDLIVTRPLHAVCRVGPEWQGDGISHAWQGGVIDFK